MCAELVIGRKCLVGGLDVAMLSEDGSVLTRPWSRAVVFQWSKAGDLGAFLRLADSSGDGEAVWEVWRMPVCCIFIPHIPWPRMGLVGDHRQQREMHWRVVGAHRRHSTLSGRAGEHQE